jgi:hypothetical protein
MIGRLEELKELQGYNGGRGGPFVTSCDVF